MSFKIVGGLSQKGVVIINSEEYVAKAKYSKEGDVDCEVKPYRPIPATAWYIPRLVAMFQHFTAALSSVKRMYILGLMLIMVVTPIVVHDTTQDTWQNAIVNMGYVLLYFIANLVCVKIFIGRWHAAEHMTIAAYEDAEQTSLEAIRRKEPIHVSCGGRWMIPFFLMFLIAECLQVLTHCPNVMWWPVGLEIVLQIDRKWGFHNIPIFRECSVLLQRYVTTSKPTEKELLTAQTALIGLVKAHEGEAYCGRSIV